jgi:hypothetical protein
MTHHRYETRQCQGRNSGVHRNLLQPPAAPLALGNIAPNALLKNSAKWRGLLETAASIIESTP